MEDDLQSKYKNLLKRVLYFGNIASISEIRSVIL